MAKNQMTWLCPEGKPGLLEYGLLKIGLENKENSFFKIKLRIPDKTIPIDNKIK